MRAWKWARILGRFRTASSIRSSWRLFWKVAAEELSSCFPWKRFVGLGVFCFLCSAVFNSERARCTSPASILKGVHSYSDRHLHQSVNFACCLPCGRSLPLRFRSSLFLYSKRFWWMKKWTFETVYRHASVYIYCTDYSRKHLARGFSKFTITPLDVLRYIPTCTGFSSHKLSLVYSKHL